MSAADHPEPVRSCIGCRRRRPQSDLVRVTKSASGIIVDGASAGRGAWVCRGSSQACVDAAISRRAFARAWRVEVTDDDERAIRSSFELPVDDEDESDAQ